MGPIKLASEGYNAERLASRVSSRPLWRPAFYIKIEFSSLFCIVKRN